MFKLDKTIFEQQQKSQYGHNDNTSSTILKE